LIFQNYASAIQGKTPTKVEQKETSSLRSLGKLPSKRATNKPVPARQSVPAGDPSKHQPVAGAKVAHPVLNCLNDDLDNMCVICHDPLSSFTTKTLDCGHVYHDMVSTHTLYDQSSVCNKNQSQPVGTRFGHEDS
jgi:hypothetical protein